MAKLHFKYIHSVHLFFTLQNCSVTSSVMNTMFWHSDVQHSYDGLVFRPTNTPSFFLAKFLNVSILFQGSFAEEISSPRSQISSLCFARGQFTDCHNGQWRHRADQRLFGIKLRTRSCQTSLRHGTVF